MEAGEVPGSWLWRLKLERRCATISLWAILDDTQHRCAMPLDLLTRLDPLRRVRCPYCLADFAAFRMHLRCGSEICRNDFSKQIDDPILTRALNGQASLAPGTALKSPWWVDPWLDPNRPVRRHLDWLLMPGELTCPMCREPTDERLCPACHQRLPERVIRQRRSGNVTVFGPQAIGKTTFLTVLLQEIRKDRGEGLRLGLRALDEEVRDRYRHEYYDITYGDRDQGVGGPSGQNRSRHTASLSLEINRRVLEPLVYELKRSDQDGSTAPLVSFSDLAGEDWEMKIDLLRREGGHLVRRSRGLLFLIDPLRIPEVADQLELSEEESTVGPADYVEDADKLATFFPRVPVRTPLAICLNKLDRWGSLLPEGSTLREIALSVPGGEPDPSLDDRVHEEVRTALRRWGQIEFLDRLEADFPKHRFFACSALGDAALGSPDQPPPMPTPLLVERPALWLLKQQKLLD